MVNISEIPALTLEQKQKFWKLGQELWQITALELYENIARNVALVIRRQSEGNSPIGVVELHWSAENPFRLLLAILRHLVNCHLTSRVRWYGQPPPQWNSIAPLLPNFVDDPFDAHENAFHLYFINEVTLLENLGTPASSINKGMLTVLPDFAISSGGASGPVHACTTTLVLDFPTVEFLRYKLEQPSIRAFLGNTGIPVYLVEQLGVNAGTLFSTQAIIHLDFPDTDWNGHHCAGIFLE